MKAVVTGSPIDPTKITIGDFGAFHRAVHDLDFGEPDRPGSVGKYLRRLIKSRTGHCQVMAPANTRGNTGYYLPARLSVRNKHSVLLVNQDYTVYGAEEYDSLDELKREWVLGS